MITYVDDHNGQRCTERLLKVTLKNGKVGVAAIGHQSSINQYDFEENILERHSIAGVLDLRFDIEQGVEAYNANQREWSSNDNRVIVAYEEMGVQADA